MSRYLRKKELKIKLDNATLNKRCLRYGNCGGRFLFDYFFFGAKEKVIKPHCRLLAKILFPFQIIQKKIKPIYLDMESYE